MNKTAQQVVTEAKTRGRNWPGDEVYAVGWQRSGRGGSEGRIRPSDYACKEFSINCEDLDAIKGVLQEFDEPSMNTIMFTKHAYGSACRGLGNTGWWVSGLETASPSKSLS